MLYIDTGLLSLGAATPDWIDNMEPQPQPESEGV